MAELSEKSFPFDSEEINGEWDREYVADDFARYFRSFISSGVFMRTSSNLQVIANGDMTVTLKPGALMVDGYRYDAENDIVIQLDPADGVLNRIDRISGTWSKADRDIHFTLQKGVPSYEPLPATLRRTAEYKDYVFADIYVAAGAISIKQTDITDQRLNTEVCGLATPFAEFDTTTLYQKIEAYYAEMQARTENWTQEEKEKFTTWFDDIKNQLAGDVAANLQLQIGTLDALKTKNKSNLVAAINEVNEKEVDVLDTWEEIQANTTAGKVAGALPVKELYSSLGTLINLSMERNTIEIPTSWKDIVPYTATEDCIYYINAIVESTAYVTLQIRLNELYIAGTNNALPNTAYGFTRNCQAIVPMKKGQILSVQIATTPNVISAPVTIISGRLK